MVLKIVINLKGEPIVKTPKEAFNASGQSGKDTLVLEIYGIEKSALQLKGEN